MGKLPLEPLKLNGWKRKVAGTGRVFCPDRNGKATEWALCVVRTVDEGRNVPKDPSRSKAVLILSLCSSLLQLVTGTGNG